jgi:hypothetical protein
MLALASAGGLSRLGRRALVGVCGTTLGRPLACFVDLATRLLPLHLAHDRLPEVQA